LSTSEAEIPFYLTYTEKLRLRTASFTTELREQLDSYDAAGSAHTGV
jgi:hypothetical protein